MERYPIGLIFESGGKKRMKLELFRGMDKLESVWTRAPDGFENDGSDYHFFTSTKIEGPWAETDKDLTMEDLKLFEVKFIKVIISSEPEREPNAQMPSTSASSGTTINPISIMMEAARSTHLPKKKISSSGVKEGTSKKDKIYNGLIDHFESKCWTFPSQQEASYIIQVNLMTSIFQVLTNAFWAISLKSFDDAHEHDKRVTALPPMADIAREIMSGAKRVKARMNVSDLIQQSGCLWSLIQKSSIRNQATLQTAVREFAQAMDSYIDYMNKKNEQMTAIQTAAQPASQIKNDVHVEYVPRTATVHKDLGVLDTIMKDEEYWSPIAFDETKHANRDSGFKTRQERCRFFESLALSTPIFLIRYDPGGNRKICVHLAKVPDTATESEKMTQSARIVAKLTPQLPEFHTREMRNIFKAKMANLVDVSPATLTFIYTQLTGDASEPKDKAMYERLLIAASGEPGIVPDLRNYNQGMTGEAYGAFWEELHKVVNEVTVADDRRHGVAHFSEWLSVRDLVKQTADRCPEGTPVPSQALVRLQFSPTNRFTRRAQSFTNRFDVKQKIQRRQLRGSHPDAHFCAAQFRYLRQRASQLIDDCSVAFMDDKAKIPVGEPGNPVSTGVRPRHSIAPSTTTISAADHDVDSKAKITPTVTLIPEVPETFESSWYQGRVGVTFHNTVTQPANPYRYAAIIKEEVSREESMKPILFKFSDGGSEHNNVHIKVQLSLIALFRLLNLDMLIACRTAPGQSFLNPVERVMGLLNLALQNTATSRDASDRLTEEILARCNGMSDIRRRIEQDEELRAKWTASVQPVIDLLEDRASRLTLKERSVCIRQPLDETPVLECIKEMFPTLPDPQTVTMAQAKKNESFIDFRRKHCRVRQYNFQVRKCDSIACCMPPQLPAQKRLWLPDPVLGDDNHYKKLEDVLGTETTDTDRPGAQANFKRQSTSSTSNPVYLDPFMSAELENEKANPGLFTNQNARMTLQCVECNKPRVVYSRKKLTTGQIADIRGQSAEYGFSCGSITEVTSAETRIRLNCGDPIELAYYSSKNLPNRPTDLCAHCGEPGDIDAALKRRFKSVLPCCEACLAIGKKHPTSLPY